MKSGESLEQYILNLVKGDGYPLIRKTDPPVRVIRWTPGHSQFTGCFLEEGMLDLTGPAGGFHVEIEVKDCKGMRFPLNKIRPHQLQRMRDLTEDKSLSGLALRLRGAMADDDHVMLLPSRTVFGAVDAGKKSLRLVDLEPLVKDGVIIEHQYRRRGDIKDFLRLLVDDLSRHC